MLQDILDRYDAFILDLWGVIHDGTALYPGVAATLAYLHEKQKRVVFLSNAPRVSAKAEAVLTKLGIPREHYIAVVTSGQVAHDALRDKQKYARYYYLGPSKDEDVIADLHAYSRAKLEDAQFILCTGYEYDGQPHSDIMPLLQQLRACNLPMLCANPDHEVVKQDGTQWLCAGMVAQAYQQLGGKVDYVGKPHAAVYSYCKELLGNGYTLCVGDNPDTDIRGARTLGYDSLLITGGILASRGQEFDAATAGATYVLPSFAIATA